MQEELFPILRFGKMNEEIKSTLKKIPAIRVLYRKLYRLYEEINNLYYEIGFQLGRRSFKILYKDLRSNKPGKYSFLDRYSIVNNKFILKKLYKTYFTQKDSRGGWIGAGLPKSVLKEGKELYTMSHIHLNMYISFLPLIKKSDFLCLDIGTGIGYGINCVASNWRKSNFIGVDYDKEAITFAKEFNSSPNIKYITRDFFNFKTKNKFDYIFVIDLLEHISADKHFALIDKSLSLLKRNGLLFLATPNAVFEEDIEHSHIGLLNKKRMSRFIKKYSSNFVEQSFIIDELLKKGDPKKFVKKDNLINFIKYQDKKKINYTSHVRIVMKK